MGSRGQTNRPTVHGTDIRGIATEGYNAQRTNGRRKSYALSEKLLVSVKMSPKPFGGDLPVSTLRVPATSVPDPHPPLNPLFSSRRTLDKLCSYKIKDTVPWGAYFSTEKSKKTDNKRSPPTSDETSTSVTPPRSTPSTPRTDDLLSQIIYRPSNRSSTDNLTVHLTDHLIDHLQIAPM